MLTNDYLLNFAETKGSSPVTVPEAKQHARIIDDTDNSLIATLLSVCTDYIENLIKSPLLTSTYHLYLSRFPSNGVIVLPAYPAHAFSSIQYHDPDRVLLTLPANTVTLTIGCPATLTLLPNKTWPNTYYNAPDWAIKCSYSAGYPTAASVPAPLKQAILLLFTHWYDNARATTTVENLKEAPYAVEMITKQYCMTRYQA